MRSNGNIRFDNYIWIDAYVFECHAYILHTKFKEYEGFKMLTSFT